ncbi:MAG: mycofactocin biosynthesis chaperone MftB [Deferrisomatales bacterium]|nr:mycofactocin biosynthesis chaperone MftB [Deferrisomatales bacterium]
MTDSRQTSIDAKRYVLYPTCRVRSEGFGLLFYDMRGPRLLFANTGDLLRPDFFAGHVGLGSALDGAAPSRRRQAHSFLDSLVQKGFLREQPVC